MRTFRTLDAHVAGEAVRLLVEGGPTVAGPTMQDKVAWMRKHAERLRQCLMLEPRGHAGMHGALFTEPATERAHAGLLFMNAGRVSRLLRRRRDRCGHACCRAQAPSCRPRCG